MLCFGLQVLRDFHLCFICNIKLGHFWSIAFDLAFCLFPVAELNVKEVCYYNNMRVSCMLILLNCILSLASDDHKREIWQFLGNSHYPQLINKRHGGNQKKLHIMCNSSTFVMLCAILKNVRRCNIRGTKKSVKKSIELLWKNASNCITAKKQYIIIFRWLKLLSYASEWQESTRLLDHQCKSHHHCIVDKV